MTKVLEVNEDGALVIPADVLNGAELHQRFTAESAGKNLLRLESNPAPSRSWTRKSGSGSGTNSQRGKSPVARESIGR